MFTEAKFKEFKTASLNRLKPVLIECFIQFKVDLTRCLSCVSNLRRGSNSLNSASECLKND